ncbi:MAG: GNAT family acetyltransferase [Chloroflexota bacterium]
MKIRTYRDGDREGVVTLWETTGIARPWLDLRAEIREKRRRDRKLFLVATVRGSIIGAVMGAYDGRRGWVYHLAIAPAQQRRGVGTAMMAALESRMARVGVIKVNLQVRTDNAAVEAFYLGLGYADDRVTSYGKWLVAPPVAKT